MSLLYSIFGVGPELNVWQMSSRTVIVFIYTVILMRISGRRAFGLRAPFDNIILVLLGAILGRAVVGASPFFPTIISGLVIALLHRLCAIFSLKPSIFSHFIKGKAIPLLKNGKLFPAKMKRSLISDEDLLEELRIHAQTNDLESFTEIYMERNGQIGFVKKK